MRGGLDVTDGIQLDFNNMMAEVVGPAHGLTEAELAEVSRRGPAHVAELGARRAAGELAWMDLPYAHDAAAQVRAAADELRDRFENLVVLGIGGSALGLIAVQRALNPAEYNLLPRARRGGPRLFVCDNIDPDAFDRVLAECPPEQTLYNVITKSGTTAETLAQLAVVWSRLEERLGAAARDHVVATTSARTGLLRAFATAHRLRSFVIPEGVGGRFSVLSPVGTFAAAMCGIDVEALLSGAARADERTRSGDLFANPALAGAAIQYLADTRKGKHIAVMMPYAAALDMVSDWFRQLWAESLGKRFNLEGRLVSVGQTPVKALGVTDQHSQVQLYTEGPNDKTFTFIAVTRFERDVAMPPAERVAQGMKYLGGKTIGQLFDAERRATQMALTDAGRPNATITLPAINAFTLGQLLYILQVQTALAGQLYNINPFDQPGVERGKLITRALMGDGSLAALLSEIQQRPQPNPKYVI
jgi:glucose-6-phosphate isomerase